MEAESVPVEEPTKPLTKRQQAEQARALMRRKYEEAQVEIQDRRDSEELEVLKLDARLGVRGIDYSVIWTPKGYAVVISRPLETTWNVYLQAVTEARDGEARMKAADDLRKSVVEYPNQATFGKRKEETPDLLEAVVAICQGLVSATGDELAKKA